MDNAFQVIRTKGLPTESSYPYTAQSTFSGKPQTSGICSAVTVLHESKYTLEFYVSVDKLKALLNIGTVAVGFEANNDFASYSSGIFRC